ncbi:hypothetical protein TCAL_10809, partial [Tigriopus californicus]
QGWTQDPHHLNKYPRYFDISLNKSISEGSYGNGHGVNRTFGILFPQNGHVIRPTCQDEAYTKNEAKEGLEERKQMEQKYLVLEEDRIFQTCHLLPQPHFVSSGEGSRWNNDIILIGGGTGTFFDRARILNADYDHTPVYRSIARYDLRPMKHDLKGCQEPQQDGKGRWVPEDKTFGYGLNIPRTRHASEIIKTTDVEHGNTTHFVFVFGGYNDEKGGQILDSVESLELETLSSFQLYDFKKESNGYPKHATFNTCKVEDASDYNGSKPAVTPKMNLTWVSTFWDKITELI